MSAVTSPRPDPLRGVHKGLRRALFQATEALGAADPAVPAETAAAVAAGRAAIAFCRRHAAEETAGVLAALEARRPSATAGVAAEHAGHAAMLERLDGLLDGVAAAAAPAECAARLLDCHRALARFTADMLVHLGHEEAEITPQLWDLFADDDLVDLTRRTIAAMTPEALRASLSFILPALAPGERVPLLGLVRSCGDAALAAAAWGAAVESLEAGALCRLAEALGLAPGGTAVEGPVLVQVDFPFTGPWGADMAEKLAALAHDIAATPGLHWKMWGEHPAGGRAGGLYLFADAASAETYLRRHVPRLQGFGVSGIVARVFTLNTALSLANRAPLAA